MKPVFLDKKEFYGDINQKKFRKGGNNRKRTKGRNYIFVIGSNGKTRKLWLKNPFV